MGSYKRNRFIDVKEGDIVNLRSYAMGKTTMSQVTVTFVGTSFFQLITAYVYIAKILVDQIHGITPL